MSPETLKRKIDAALLRTQRGILAATPYPPVSRPILASMKPEIGREWDALIERKRPTFERWRRAEMERLAAAADALERGEER